MKNFFGTSFALLHLLRFYFYDPGLDLFLRKEVFISVESFLIRLKVEVQYKIECTGANALVSIHRLYKKNNTVNTMNEVEFSSLRGFPKIFQNFIEGKKEITDRFPSNETLLSNKINYNLFNDKKNSGFVIDLKNTILVAACLKPCFLGGTVSNFLKIHSAIQLAKQLGVFHQNINFKPAIIVEDNDIDNLEASQAVILDNNLTTQRFYCVEKPDKKDKRCLSERQFDSFTSLVPYSIDESLTDGDGKSEILSLMKKVYTIGKSWSDGYIDFCSEIFTKYDLTFIKASQARKKSAFNELVTKEVMNPGISYSIVTNAKSLLNAYGYDLKEKASDINLNYHENNMLFKIEQMDIHDRYKIGRDLYSYKDIKHLILKCPDCYSPAVILKHTFYSYFLPIAAYVVSPSELGYLSLTKELFDFFKTRIPAIIPRHSATFLLSKIISDINKSHKDSMIFNYIFPEGTLQERIISPIYFMSICGINEFNKLCEQIVAKNYYKHYTVVID